MAFFEGIERFDQKKVGCKNLSNELVYEPGPGAYRIKTSFEK